MAFSIHLKRPLEEECRRIGMEQIDRCLAELGDETLDIHQRVHQLRKRTKKLRALARLFRPADEDWYRRVNADFRDLAARFSELRDAQAALDTLESLLARYAQQIDRDAFEPVVEALAARRSAMAGMHPAAPDLSGVQETLREMRLQARDWLDGGASLADVSAGFALTYGRGRKALIKASRKPDAPVWHEWRKRAKYHRYHWKLLQKAWPGPIKGWRKEMHRLTDYLGDDHDLTELTRIAREQVDDQRFAQTLDVLEGLATARGLELRHDALSLGLRLYADKRGAARRRLVHWVEVKRKAGRA